MGGACLCPCLPPFTLTLSSLRFPLCCPQAVERQSAEAVAVSLGIASGHAQAHLDGFKARALRSDPAASTRHLYATEWRTLKETATPERAPMLVVGGAAPMPSPPGHGSSALPTPMAVAAVAASRGRQTPLAPLASLEPALALVQAWVNRYSE